MSSADEETVRLAHPGARVSRCTESGRMAVTEQTYRAPAEAFRLGDDQRTEAQQVEAINADLAAIRANEPTSALFGWRVYAVIFGLWLALILLALAIRASIPQS